MAQKRHTRPVMAKIIVACSTQMVLIFIDSKGVIYPDHISWGATVNTDYIIGAPEEVL